MNTSSHKLANLKQRELKLRDQRKQILSKDSETALEMILDAPSPATLIQSFPDQDLYYLMHKIGPEDFIPILALARSDQWEHVLDVEVWEDDRLNTAMMSKSFGLLFQAAPERFLRWIIKEKPDYFEFFLFRNMDIWIREHDDLPPEDFDDYVTLDDKFYFRFPNKPMMDHGVEELPQADHEDETEAFPLPDMAEETAELIEQMMKKLAEMDLSVFHGLLLETLALLPAESEEEQFRMKTLRLAEKGFLPAHEAIGIYQPADIKQVRQRPKTIDLDSPKFDPELPLPPQFFAQFIQGDDLFVNTLSQLPRAFIFRLESEMAALINKIISADRIKIREREALEKTIQKATAYLSLGLEVLAQAKEEQIPAEFLIRRYFLEDIFRTGSRTGIRLKTRAEDWYRQSFIREKKLPLSFLGEQFLGVIGGLFLDRPLFFDNYRSGVLYRHFKTLNEIETTSVALNQVMALDDFLHQIAPDLESFEHGVLTYKSLILTLWARNRIGLVKSLAPIPVDQFKPFFKEMFLPLSGQKGQDRQDLKFSDMMLWALEAMAPEENHLKPVLETLLEDMLREITDEYATILPDHIDPRFMPHFLLS